MGRRKNRPLELAGMPSSNVDGAFLSLPSGNLCETTIPFSAVRTILQIRRFDRQPFLLAVDIGGQVEAWPPQPASPMPVDVSVIFIGQWISLLPSYSKGVHPNNCMDADYLGLC
jgi:hypothetical protein